MGQAVAEAGELVLSELVTNALRAPAPGDRMVGVRIECRERGGLLRLQAGEAVTVRTGGAGASRAMEGAGPVSSS
ncbi:hypothetical protein GCM10010518_36450 [Kitasatospora cinereorecta]